jgi:preprotein translocase subunit SecG
MYTLIVILHVIVSVALILVILLQTGKGSDIGAVFGGGSSQTLFGSTGPTSFLSKLTAGAAIIFMLTSLFLAYFSGSGASRSIMKSGTGAPVQTMPAPPAGMPAAPVGVPAMPGAPAAPPAGMPAPPVAPPTK